MDYSRKKNWILSRRHFIRYGTAVTVAGFAAGHKGGAVAAAGTSQPAKSYLIQNATILTMDSAIGDIASGDVLIRGEKIVEVGRNLRASADQIIDGTGHIILPGFIDGHRHLWHTAMRHQHDVWGYGKYRTEGINRHSVCYSPEDMEIGAYAGGLEALNAGVTTVVDFCHNPRTPEHMEAALAGNLNSGVGGYFCYSLGATPRHGPGDTVEISNSGGSSGDDEWRFEHSARMKTQYFADPSAHLKFGIAPSYLEIAAKFNPGIAKKEIDFARDLQADIITIHVHNFDEFRLVPFLDDDGLLTENMLLAHANGVTPEELDVLAARGVSIASTPETEVPYGEFPAYGEARARGVDTSLGADSVVFNGSDLFVAMRISLQMQRYHEATLGTDSSSMAQTRDLLESATIGGAKAVGLDTRVGSISPGKQADLMLINTNTIYHQPVSDAVSAVVFNSGASDVTDVWVAGKRVKKNGTLVGVDWPATTNALTASRDRIVRLAQTITLVGD